MSELPYLLQLADRLTAGLQAMDPARRERHRAFILSQQMADGGFRGREGDSDLYYTGFALRGLSILGAMTDDDGRRVAGYLRQNIPRTSHAIDVLSWLYSAIVAELACEEELIGELPGDWMARVAADLEALRRPDGGYAKAAEGAAGSTYHSFMISLVYELIGHELPDPKALVQYLFDRQRDDGGFVEIGPMKNSGTNPTAAAVALLKKFGRIDDELRDDVRAFLKDVRSDEGGFQANRRVPFADGLSTFTGLLTCRDLELGEVIPRDRTAAYLKDGIEFPTGGFRGATWDVQADVEYTFYGLGIAALIGGG